MTDSDERLLTAAKLGEQARDNLDGEVDLLEHLGNVDGDDLASIAVVEEALEQPFAETPIGKQVLPVLASKRANRALEEGKASVLSNMVGVTEQDLDGSALTIPLKLLDRMENDGAPAFFTAAGNPNTGKTNTMIKLLEMRKVDRDDLLIVSNVRSWGACDIHVTSAHDLAVALLEHRETSKAVMIDEGSTHFDARTYRQEVATQYTPLAKRYAKIGVDVEAVIVHTGKDLHPERKRLSTTAFYKEAKETAEFFDHWPADTDRPVDQLFGGRIDDLEKADGYDPNDSAPWSWDLEPELFTEDLPWPNLLEKLRARDSEKN